jgi:hypothetical protein
MVFEPMPAHISPVWLTPALLGGLLALLLMTIAWPVSALVRRHYRAPYPLTGQDAQAHRRIRIASTAVVATFIAWGVTLTAAMGDSELNDLWLLTLQLLTAVALIGAAAIGVWNAIVVVRSQRKWYAKTWAVLLGLALLVVLWFALAFHLIAFDTNY